MTTTKHTPGPWRVDLNQPFTLDGDSVEVQAVTKDGKMVRRGICQCLLDTTDWPNSPEAMEDAANARLISLAPELAQALETLSNAIETRIEGGNSPWIPGGNFHDGTIQSALSEARAILSKLQ